MQKWFFLIKTRDRLWTVLVYLKQQRPNNVVIIGKQWNNQYCHNRLILEIDFKGALMQIWKSLYMIVFILKQYSESFAFLILRIFELFTREVCQFPKK